MSKCSSYCHHWFATAALERQIIANLWGSLLLGGNLWRIHGNQHAQKHKIALTDDTTTYGLFNGHIVARGWRCSSSI
eukprot:scaffold39216_cov300-Skeletonema_dohrnii-CCMP3373.AAC.1